MNLAQLIARLEKLRNDAAALQAAAADAGRDLSADEAQNLDTLLAEGERLKGDIDRLQRLEALGSATGSGGHRQTAPEPRQAQNAPAPIPDIRAPIQNQQERDRWGWRNIQEFARAVRNHAVGGGVDSRLLNAPTTYGQEAVGQDGGFAVPPDWRAEINRLITGEESFLARLDGMPTESNGINVPVDEDPAWGSSSGIRVFTRAEAGSFAQSKPQMKMFKCDLTTIYAFVPMTDELLDDAPLMRNFLTVKSSEKIDFKVNDLVVNGPGGANPLGILNSPALVTVTKESSQTAATIVQANILKMWSRMPARARANAVWLINQDCEPQIHALGQVVSTASGTAVSGAPMFIPPGGMNQSPNGTILGRPIVPTEACQTLGTKGDIIFANLKGYAAPYKASGVKSDVSMHLYFDTGETAFRWSFRMGGSPWLSTPISRKNGSNTLSDFVCVETR